jgi:hypothetical protein
MFTELRTKITPHGWFGDSRLSKRFGLIVEQLGTHIGSSIRESTGKISQSQAIYRFMDNEKVTMERLNAAEKARVKELISQDKPSVLLMISDTTDLDYTGQESAINLGCLNWVNRKGFYLQSQLALDGQGCPLGLWHQYVWHREATTLGELSKSNVKEYANQKTPIEDKESYRWLRDFEDIRDYFNTQSEHQVIHICDREADIFELMAAQKVDNPHNNIHYVIRSQHNRLLADDTNKLWEAVGKLENGGIYDIELKAGRGLPKRKTQLEIRWKEATLKVPQRFSYPNSQHGTYSNLKVSILEAKEVLSKQVRQELPKGAEPIHWFIITSLPIQNLQDAIQIMTYYGYRWHIEEFHVILKQGCAIEKLQLHQAHNLKNAIALFSIVAVHVLRWRYLYEYYPEKPLELVGLSPKDYQTLCLYLNKAKNIEIPSTTQPTVADYIRTVACLGCGKIKNKAGIRALWKGTQVANIVLEAFDAFSKSQ